ncbi:GNAT family N-acetyltransferase [Streptomyces sp. NPDC101118]|uniref:GNAT family N-acetyltransferase n=1 Tax=Streptomyces sp. NPDC101118 TaxID=3366109 RepID=UPI0038188A91
MTSPTTPAAPTRPAVFTQHVDGLGTVTVSPLDPAADSPLVHSWVTQERARFWGMREASLELVREIYEDVDRRTTHHAFLVRLDGQPVMLFQTYEPAEDRVSECYEVRPGDIGVHLMLAPSEGPAVPGFSGKLLGALMTFTLAGGATRIVAEPDASNTKAIARLQRTGFELGPEVELPEIDLPEVYLPAKQARLCFLNVQR